MEQQSHRKAASEGTLRRGLGVAVAACVSLGLLTSGCVRGRKAPSADDLTAEVVPLRQSVAQLERQLDLAGGKAFYLVLDPAAPDLALMLSGAELQRYPVLGLQVGHPKVLFVSRRDRQAWQGAIWSDGDLDPPRPTDRIVINAEAPGETADEATRPPIPPTAEELYRVPPRFHVRFGGGLSLEIRPREADASSGRFAQARTWWSTKWGDVAAALGIGDRDVVRLRVVLNPKDAESLYRCLPPSVRLLVLSGGLAAKPVQPPAAAPAGSTRQDERPTTMLTAAGGATPQQP